MAYHFFCFVYGVVQILIAEDGFGTGCQNVVVAVSPKRLVQDVQLSTEKVAKALEGGCTYRARKMIYNSGVDRR